MIKYWFRCHERIHIKRWFSCFFPWILVVLPDVSEGGEMQQVQLAVFVLKSLHLSLWSDPPEPQPVFDLLCEDPRPPVLHGGPIPRGHEDLDGCHSNGCRGLHAVHELRDHWLTDWEDDTHTPASQPELLSVGAGAGNDVICPDGVCAWVCVCEFLCVRVPVCVMDGWMFKCTISSSH